MRSKIKMLILAFAAVIVSACAQAPVSPESPRETLALVQSMREAAYNTIADLAKSGSIDRSQYDGLMKRMSEADTALGLSMAALRIGKTETQIEQLMIARSILLDITRDLAAKQPRSNLREMTYA